MDVPDLVRQAVGDEEIRAGVNVGDEDAVVFTPSRVLVYRGEGLLSDEDVETYGFDFERLAVSEGRRKTKYTMTYVDAERSFTVPGKRTDDVLEKLIEGTLRVVDAVDDQESVTGVFRFSEMTLVVTERRLLKHIGEYTWDPDFEGFPYDDLTKLAFEEGSVATQVVLGVGNRSERIKAPNAEAGLVQKAIQEAVFAHHGVSSLEELNREIAVEADEDAGKGDVTGGLGLDSGIDPLVSEDRGSGDTEGAGDREPSSSHRESQSPSADETRREDQSRSQARSSSSQRSGSQASSAGSSGTTSSASGSQSRRSSEPSTGGESAGHTRSSGPTSSQSGTRSEAPNRSSDTGERTASSSAETESIPSVEAGNEDVLEQLADLTRAVEHQNELLHRQQRTVEKLIEELRQGR